VGQAPLGASFVTSNLPQRTVRPRLAPTKGGSYVSRSILETWKQVVDNPRHRGQVTLRPSATVSSSVVGGVLNGSIRGTSMRTIRIALLISAVAILLSVANKRVEAGGNGFTSTFSGTFVTTDLDLDAVSCTGNVCTDLSYLDTIAGKTSGGIEGGQFTGQSVVELAPVSGTGCAFATMTIQGCTLGTVTNACEFQSVGPGSKADRYGSTGDILTGSIPVGGETLCFDSATGNHAGSVSGSITGGSGKFAGVTGTFMESFHGKTLASDPQGHGFGWFQAELNGTVIKP
jgi:hypothetical protein